MRGIQLVSAGLSVHMETKQVEKLLKKLLFKVENPKPLMSNIERWVHAMTMKMFNGRRADVATVREVKWPKLKPSTIKMKKDKIKRGKAIALRPMIETGEMRDSLKVLNRSKRGFVYGTKTTGNKGFGYPGYHNKGRFPFLFIRDSEFNQIISMTIDYLQDKLKNFKNYAGK